MTKATGMFKRARRAFAGKQYRQHAEENPVVVTWCPMGGAVELLGRELSMALALNQRGVNNIVCLCGGALSACCLRSFDDGKTIAEWGRICEGCQDFSIALLEQIGMPYRLMKDYLPRTGTATHRRMAQDYARNPENFSYKGLKTSFFALTSTVRYFKGKERKVDTRLYRAVLEEYFYSTLVCTDIAEEFLIRERFDKALFSNIQYAESGPAHDLFCKNGRRADVLMGGYKIKHLYAVHGSIERGPNLVNIEDNAWEALQTEELTSEENRELDKYFSAVVRERSKNLFSASGQENLDGITISSNKPLWVLFAHVHWDMIFEKGQDLFLDVQDWVLQSIRYMSGIPEVNWVIRCHPGERLDGTIMKTVDLIREECPQLPKHIQIAHGPHPNSYKLLERANGCVTIRSTAGLEALMLGKPAILAGPSYYGRKGFTYDADSRDHYHELLTSTPDIPPLDKEQTRLVRLLAHYHFIRRQIPFEIYDPISVETEFQALEELAHRRDKGVDILCNGILNNTPFELPRKEE